MAPSEKINIPQQPPMVMVDEVISCEEKTTITGFFISQDNIFCEEGIFREEGLIENMAQTVAAHAGSFSNGPEGKAKTGFIGAIKDLKINHLPRAGEKITTKATITLEFGDARVVFAEIFLDEKSIASCELKIFLENSNG